MLDKPMLFWSVTDYATAFLATVAVLVGLLGLLWVGSTLWDKLQGR